MKRLCHRKAQGIAQKVMTDDDAHDEKSRLKNARRIDRNDTADNENDRDNRDERQKTHDAPNHRSKECIDENACDNRNDDDLHDGDHHARERNLYPLPCNPPGEKRRYDRSENSCHHRH